MSITRRHLIATSAVAGAGAVVSACGGDARPERSAERDAELLQRALDAQRPLLGLYRLAASQQLAPGVANALEAFEEQTVDAIDDLSRRIEDAGGEAGEGDAAAPEGESVVEAIRIALDEAIAVAHEVVGGLSAPEPRRAVSTAMVIDAGQLAVIRGALGEDQVPVAFVTGGPEPPLAAAPATDDEGEGE